MAKDRLAAEAQRAQRKPGMAFVIAGFDAVRRRDFGRRLILFWKFSKKVVNKVACFLYRDNFMICSQFFGARKKGGMHSAFSGL
jgi:hypothetical protein